MKQDQEEPLLSSSDVYEQLERGLKIHHVAKESTAKREGRQLASGMIKYYQYLHILLTIGLLICYIPAILLFIASGERSHRYATHSRLLPGM